MIQKWKRKKAAVPEVAEPEEMSPLALSLLEQFSMGMSGPSVQAIALAATKSGATGPGIAELASLGNQPTHCQSNGVEVLSIARHQFTSSLHGRRACAGKDTQ